MTHDDHTTDRPRTSWIDTPFGGFVAFASSVALILLIGIIIGASLSGVTP